MFHFYKIWALYLLEKRGEEMKKRLLKINNFHIKNGLKPSFNFQEVFNNLVYETNKKEDELDEKIIKKSLSDYAIDSSIINKNLLDEDDSF